MEKNAVILVTGARGMVGAAVARLLRARGFSNVLAPDRAELDCRDASATERYFAQHRPRYLFISAARVGGIAANMSDPVGFTRENLEIELTLFEAARRHALETVLFLGSSCIYPREAAQPIKESALMTGPLEPTNEGYALAKIVGIHLAKSYREQYGLKSISPMPCNVYGTGDHFDLARSHVLSALVRRFVDAVDTGAPVVSLWGTGVARREFIHVDDLAEALLFLLERYDSPDIINVGT